MHIARRIGEDDAGDRKLYKHLAAHAAGRAGRGTVRNDGKRLELTLT